MLFQIVVLFEPVFRPKVGSSDTKIALIYDEIM